MIELFKSILSDARDHSRSLKWEIISLKENVGDYKKSILECERYITNIQNKVGQIGPGNSFVVFEDTDESRFEKWERSKAGIKQKEKHTDLWHKFRNKFDLSIHLDQFKYPIFVNSSNSAAYNHLISSWGLAIQHFKELIKETEKEIKRLQKEKDELDFWILEKETRWNPLNEELIDEQLTQILEAGNHLSRLLVDREVDLHFEYQDGGSPARVSTLFKERKKIFLSIDVIGNQPRNVVDVYKGLILHELGHFLLHLGDTAKEYRRFQSLLSKKITVAPDFYSLFNILLDEQLERRLRDRMKEWQTWFNRLTFYLRTMELYDLKKRIQKIKYPDKGLSEIDLSEWIEKRWIKTYQDENFPMVAIQSAEFLTEEYGFQRMEAFFYTFRGRLPKSTVDQKWLQLCLDQIPADFKTLDIFEVHRLAERIYRIITEDLQAKKLVMLTIIKNNGEEMELPVPDLTGVPPAGQEKDRNGFLIDVRDKRNKKGSKLAINPQESTAPPYVSRSQSFSNVANPEGEPEPPKVEEKDEMNRSETPSKTKARKGIRVKGRPGRGGKKVKFRNKDYSRYSRSPAWGGTIGAGSGLGIGKSSGKAKGSKNRKKVKAGKTANKVNVSVPRQVSRRQKENSPKPASFKSPSVSESINNRASKSRIDPQNQFSKQKKKLAKQLNNRLDKIKESLKAEQTGVFEENKMTPEGGKSSDFKNTNPTKLFPACEKIIRLKTDALKLRKLQLMSKRYVQWLRPGFSRIDQVKQMQLKQSAGKSMMNSAVKNFIIYGEPQIFRNFKVEDKEEYSDVHISILLDTSASMQTDERMKHAQILGALFAECLTDCPGISTDFYAYNQNLYLCGDHENYSIAQLEPSGKTNEAAALHHIQKDLEAIARPIKILIVVTDGLPTACSVEAVKWQVAEMEHQGHIQCIACIFSKEEHPAYRYPIDFSSGITRASVMKLGKRFGYLL